MRRDKRTADLAGKNRTVPNRADASNEARRGAEMLARNIQRGKRCTRALLNLSERIVTPQRGIGVCQRRVRLSLFGRHGEEADAQHSLGR